MATRMQEMAESMSGTAQKADRGLASLARLELLLELLLQQFEGDPALVCVVDDEAPPQVISKDFPYEGATRAIVQRTPLAPPSQVPPASAGSVLLFDVNVNRLGGMIVNKSTVGLTLVFGREYRAGMGMIWLAPNGSWDFKLGNLLWCGHVLGIPDSLAVSVAGVEV